MTRNVCFDFNVFSQQRILRNTDTFTQVFKQSVCNFNQILTNKQKKTLQIDFGLPEPIQLFKKMILVGARVLYADGQDEDKKGPSSSDKHIVT